MAQYPNVPQFNIADFLSRSRQAKLKDQNAGGVDYTDLLKQQAAENQGYTTSSSFAGIRYTDQRTPDSLAISNNFNPELGSGNIINATIGTIKDISNNVLYGATSVVEGVVDFLFGLGGWAGKQLGANTEGLEDFIKMRWSDDLASLSTEIATAPLELFLNPQYSATLISAIQNNEFNVQDFIDGRYSSVQYSLINSKAPGQTSFVEDVAQGVGQLLPVIAIAAATGGAGAAAAGTAGATSSVGGVALSTTAAKAVSIGFMSSGAAGNTFEQSLKDGMDYNDALLYGTANGAVEAITETIIGAGINKVAGAVTSNLSNTARRALASTIGRAVQAGVEEGLEEVSAEVLGSVVDWALLQDDQAFAKRLTFDNLSRTFLTTFVSSGIGNVAFQQPVFINNKRASRTTASLLMEKATFQQISGAEQNRGNADYVLSNEEKPFMEALQPMLDRNELEADENGEFEAYIPNVGSVRFNIAADAQVTTNQLNDLRKKYKRYDNYQNILNEYDQKIEDAYKEDGITQEDFDKEMLRSTLPSSIQQVDDQINQLRNKNGQYFTVDEKGEIKQSVQTQKAQKVFSQLNALLLKKKSLQYHRDSIAAKYKTADEIVKELQDNNWRDITPTLQNIDDAIKNNSPLKAELQNFKIHFPNATEFISAVGLQGQTFIMPFENGKPVFYNELYFENKAPSIKDLALSGQEIQENAIESIELGEKYVEEQTQIIINSIFNYISNEDFVTTIIPKNSPKLKKIIKVQIKGFEDRVTKLLKELTGQKGYVFSFKTMQDNAVTKKANFKNIIVGRSNAQWQVDDLNQKLVALLRFKQSMEGLRRVMSRSDIDYTSAEFTSYMKDTQDAYYEVRKFLGMGVDLTEKRSKAAMFGVVIPVVKQIDAPKPANKRFPKNTSNNRYANDKVYAFSHLQFGDSEELQLALKSYAYNNTPMLLKKGFINENIAYIDPFNQNNILIADKEKFYTPEEFAKNNRDFLVIPSLKDSISSRGKRNSLQIYFYNNVLTEEQRKTHIRLSTRDLAKFIDVNSYADPATGMALDKRIEDIVKTLTKEEIVEFLGYIGYTETDLQLRNFNNVDTEKNIENLKKEGFTLPVLKFAYNELTGEMFLTKQNQKFLAFMLYLEKNSSFSIYAGSQSIDINSEVRFDTANIKTTFDYFTATVDTYSKKIPDEIKSALQSNPKYILNEYVAEKENNPKYIKDDGVEVESNVLGGLKRFYDSNFGEISLVPFPQYYDLYKAEIDKMKSRPYSQQEMLAKERALFTPEQRDFLRKLDTLETSNSALNLFNAYINDARNVTQLNYRYTQQDLTGWNRKPLNSDRENFAFGLFNNFKEMLDYYKNTKNKLVFKEATIENLRETILNTGGATVSEKNIVGYTKGYQVAFDKRTELIFNKYSAPKNATQEEIDKAKEQNVDDALAFVFGHRHTESLLYNVGFWFGENGDLYLDASSMYVEDFFMATYLQFSAEQISIATWKDGSVDKFPTLESKIASYTGQDGASVGGMEQDYLGTLYRQKGLNVKAPYFESYPSNRDVTVVNTISALKALEKSGNVRDGSDVYAVVSEGEEAGLYKWVYKTQDEFQKSLGNLNIKRSVFVKVSDPIYITDYFTNSPDFLEFLFYYNFAEKIGADLSNFEFLVDSVGFGELDTNMSFQWESSFSTPEFQGFKRGALRGLNGQSKLDDTLGIGRTKRLFFENKSNRERMGDLINKALENKIQTLAGDQALKTYQAEVNNFGLSSHSDFVDFFLSNKGLFDFQNIVDYKTLGFEQKDIQFLSDLNSIKTDVENSDESGTFVKGYFQGIAEYKMFETVDKVLKGKTEVGVQNNFVDLVESRRAYRKYLKQSGQDTMTKSWDGSLVDFSLDNPLSDQDQEEIIKQSNQFMYLHDGLVDVLYNYGSPSPNAISEKDATKMIVWVDTEQLVNAQELKRDGLWKFNQNGDAVDISFRGADEDEVADLMKSIVGGGQGLYQPIVLAYDIQNGSIEIKDGNHRFSAMWALGMKKVPVIMVATTNKQIWSLNAMTSLATAAERFDVYNNNLNFSTAEEDVKHFVKLAAMNHAVFVKSKYSSPLELDIYNYLALPSDILDVENSVDWSGQFGTAYIVNAYEYLKDFFDSGKQPSAIPSLKSDFSFYARYKLDEATERDAAMKANEIAFEKEKLRLEAFYAEQKQQELDEEAKRADFDLQVERNAVDYLTDFLEDPEQVTSLNKVLEKMGSPKEGKKRFYLINTDINKQNYLTDGKEIKASGNDGYILIPEEQIYDYIQNSSDTSVETFLNNEFLLVDLNEDLLLGNKKFVENINELDDLKRTAYTLKTGLLYKPQFIKNVYSYKGKIYLNDVAYADIRFNKKGEGNIYPLNVSFLLNKHNFVTKSNNKQLVLNSGLFFKKIFDLRRSFIQQKTKIEDKLSKLPSLSQKDQDFLYEIDAMSRLLDISSSLQDFAFERAAFTDPYNSPKNFIQGDTGSVWLDSVAKQLAPETFDANQMIVFEYIKKVGSIIEKRREEGSPLEDFKNKPYQFPNFQDVKKTTIENAINEVGNFTNDQVDSFVLTQGLLKWFTGKEWSKELRLAVFLYVSTTEPSNTYEKGLLNRFMLDFGLIDQSPLAEVKNGKEVYYPAKNEFLPTYLRNIRNVLLSTRKAENVKFLFKQSNTNSKLLGGYVATKPASVNVNLEVTDAYKVDQKGNVNQITPMIGKKAQFSQQDFVIVMNYPGRVSNVIIHELNHFLLDKADPRTVTPGVYSQYFELQQSYVEKALKVVDYIRNMGNEVYSSFIGMMADSYAELYNSGNIQLNLSSEKYKDSQGNERVAYFIAENSLEEEALGELLAQNISGKTMKFVESDPVLKSMVDDLRANFISAVVLNKNNEVKLSQTEETLFSFDVNQNQKLEDILSEKVLTQPTREPDEPITRKMTDLFVNVQEAVQDMAAPLLRAFDFFGSHSEGDALLQQIRSATARTEQYIVRGIYDTENNVQIAKPLYSPNFNGDGIFDFLVRQETVNKRGKKVMKYIANDQLSADFFLYNFLVHNTDSQNLYKKKFRLNQFTFSADQDLASDSGLTSRILNWIGGRNQNPIITEEDVNRMFDGGVLTEPQRDAMLNQLRYYITIFGKFVTVSDQTGVVLPKKLLLDLDNVLFGSELVNILKTKGAVQSQEVENWFIETINKIKANGQISDNQKRKLIKQYQALRNELRLFYQEVDVKTSKMLVERMDKKYPEFAQKNKDLVQYLKVMFAQQLEAGLITQEAYDELNQNFPNYVPVSREYLTGTASQGIIIKKMLSVRNPIMKRNGSNRLLVPLDISVARRTQLANRAIAINNMMNALYDKWEATGFQENPYLKNAEFIKEQRRTSIHDEIAEDFFDVSGETITFYRKGVKVQVVVGKGLARALENMTLKSGRELGIIGDGIRKLSIAFRNVVTQYSIIFQARNLVRDQFNSTILSKNGLFGVQAYSGISLALIASGGTIQKMPGMTQAEADELNKYYREFMQNGGSASSLYSHDEGISPGIYFSQTRVNKPGKINKFIRTATNALEKGSVAIELIPRLAEYILSRKNGKSIAESINDAANVTVNFSKAGTFGRLLNTFGFTFLNANIQGTANLIKRLVTPGSLKAWAGVISKFAILGIAASVFNELLYGGDDDYEELPDYVKEQNFLIQIGDKFIMVPKGQILSQFNYFWNISEKAKDPEFTIFEAFKTVDPFNGFRNIFSPFVDVATNTTWYGGQIVSTRYEGLRPENQYTATTSNFAKWLGGILNYSPLKIDYLLNSYGGIFYDVFMSNNSIFESDRTAGFESFIADPVDSNRNSSDFFNYYTLVTWDRSEGDVIASAQYTYMNRVRGNINLMYAEMEKIRLNTTLSKEEQNQQIRTLQIMVNMAYKQGLINVQRLGDALQNYQMSAESYEEDVLDAYKQLFGGEYALRTYNKSVHEKAVLLNKFGFSFDQYYDYYFMMKQMPDLQSRQRYINRLNLPRQVKELLYYQAGGSLPSDRRKNLVTLLVRYGVDKDEANSMLRVNEGAQEDRFQSIYKL